MNDQIKKLPWAAREYRAVLAHYLNMILPKEAAVVQVGVSSGELLSSLHGSVKMGVDSDPSVLEIARTRNPGALLSCCEPQYYKPPSSPDYTLIPDTLNHVGDVQALLERVRDYTPATGRLVVSVYNTLWRPVLALATALGLRKRKLIP